MALPHPQSAFPWSTFATNVSGCFLIGVLMVAVAEGAGGTHRLARPFLGVGVLGGFTTFCTYAVDTDKLVSAGAPRLGVVYLVGMLLAALAAVQIGVVATSPSVPEARKRSASSPDMAAASLAAAVLGSRNRAYRQIEQVEGIDADEDGIPDTFQGPGDKGC